MKITKQVNITLNQFEILVDALYEIEEFRNYDGEEEKTLNELQKIFSYRNYINFKNNKGDELK